MFGRGEEEVKAVLIIAVIITLNNIFMSLYCMFKDKQDSKKRARKDILQKSTETQKLDSASSKKHGLKSILIHIYQKTDHYVYGLMRYEVIMVGKLPSHRIRNFLYRFVFQMKATSKSVIYGGCEFRSPWNI